jgi:hypothetical protein
MLIAAFVFILFVRNRKGDSAPKGTTGMLKGMTMRLGSSAADTRGWLRVVQGASVGQEFPLGKNSIVRIGRDPQFSDIALRDQYTSNPHASVVFEDGQFFIADDGSTNGTKLNGEIIKPQHRVPLEDGDIIELGGTQLEFRSTLQQWFDQIEDLLRQTGKVRLEDLKGLPRSRYRVLSDYAAVNPELDVVYSQEDQELALRRREEFTEFKESWNTMRATTDVVRAPEPMKQVVKTFSKLLDLREPDPRINNCGGLYFTFLDTGLIFQGLNIPTQIPVFFLLNSRVDSQQIDDIRYTLTTLSEMSNRLFLLANIGTNQEPEKIVWLLSENLTKPFAYDPVLLTFDDLYTILVAHSPREAFRQLILSHVNLVTVSPYSTTGPTPDNVFFGRETESREIVENLHDKSFAVIGGRRIGKTSLLSRLHRIRLPGAGFRTIYHDCSTTPTYETFMHADIRNWRPEPPPGAPNQLAELLRFPTLNEPYVLLLDEADKLVPDDHTSNWMLFSKLRALGNQGQAQVILSGERKLREALRDPDSPLFNFTSEILLGPLSFSATKELVTRPMTQLGIKLMDVEVIVNRIWSFTGGHPNVIQRLCSRLIENINQQDGNQITLADVNKVLRNPGFQRDDFLTTYWEAATVLEKIITLLMADNQKIRSLSTMLQALQVQCELHPTAKEVDESLQRLVDLRSILKRTATGYEFAVEAFPRVIAGTTTLNDMLRVFAEEYQESNG